MAEWKKGRSSRKKATRIIPSRGAIQSAVDEYLKKGGKITKLDPIRDYDSILKIKTPSSEADEFLSGN